MIICLCFVNRRTDNIVADMLAVWARTRPRLMTSVLSHHWAKDLLCRERACAYRERYDRAWYRLRPRQRHPGELPSEPTVHANNPQTTTTRRHTTKITHTHTLTHVHFLNNRTRALCLYMCEPRERERERVSENTNRTYLPTLSKYTHTDLKHVKHITRHSHSNSRSPVVRIWICNEYDTIWQHD